MLVGQPRDDAAARGPFQHAALQQIGFVDILDGVPFLAHRHRQRTQTDRAAVELLDDQPQDLPVDLVQTLAVHFQQPERASGDVAGDAAFGFHLRVIAYAPEQPVADARRAPGAAGDLHQAVRLGFDPKDGRGTSGDF